MFGMKIRRTYTARTMSRRPGYTRYELVRSYAEPTPGPGSIVYERVSSIWEKDYATGRRSQVMFESAS